MPDNKKQDDKFTWKEGQIKFIPPEQNKKDKEEEQNK